MQGRRKELWIEFIGADMRFLSEGNITHHMERRKSSLSNRFLRKFRMILQNLMKRSWRFRGSYKKRIEKRNNIGNKKVELSGIPVGTEIRNFVML